MEDIENRLKLEQAGVPIWNMLFASENPLYGGWRLSTEGSFLLIFPIDPHYKDLSLSKSMNTQ